MTFAVHCRRWIGRLENLKLLMSICCWWKILYLFTHFTWVRHWKWLLITWSQVKISSCILLLKQNALNFFNLVSYLQVFENSTNARLNELTAAVFSPLKSWKYHALLDESIINVCTHFMLSYCLASVRCQNRLHTSMLQRAVGAKQVTTTCTTSHEWFIGLQFS